MRPKADPLDKIQRDEWSWDAAKALEERIAACGDDKIAQFGYMREALYKAVQHGKRTKS